MKDWKVMEQGARRVGKVERPAFESHGSTSMICNNCSIIILH